MATTSLVQVRVDGDLKEQASKLYEGLGIDLSTAVRMFLKRSVLVNGVPFSMTLPKSEYEAERALRAVQETSEASGKNGLSDMPLSEINVEMDTVRQEMKGA